MNTLRQAAMQALNVLQTLPPTTKTDIYSKAITALREALEPPEQPEQEPVTQWTGCGECDCAFKCHNGESRCIRLPVQRTYPLPDDLYEGKDWRAAGNYAERVEWLHVMYESKKQELEAYLDAQRKPLTDEIVRLAGVALHEMPRPRTDWHSCAKLVCEAVVAHGIKEGT